MRLDAGALDARRFDRARLDLLYAAIEVNDLIDPAAAPPPAVRLDYRQANLVEGYRLSRQLWREGHDRAALIGTATTLARGGPFGRDEQRAFKQVRAKFKHLRFAFVLYRADHRCPAAFKAITTTMGQLQDAVRGGRQQAVRRQALLLRGLLANLPQQLLAREVDRVSLTDPHGFRAFTLAQIAALRRMLGSPTINGHRFHAARKIVSRQVSFHDDMRTLAPDADLATMARYLATINGLMGQHHDLLVARAAAGDGYGGDEFAMPEPIRERLAKLVALYP